MTEDNHVVHFRHLSGDNMLSENTPFLTIDQTCTEAVDWFMTKVRQAGLSPVRTFDLQVARQTQTDCPCPHHGTAACDCQMVVLLVYMENMQPLAIIAHGYNGQTWFSVVDTPQQRANPYLAELLRHSVEPPDVVSADSKTSIRSVY